MTARLHHDQRGIVLSFLLKVVLSLALVGLITVETTAVIFARFQAQDIAESAAFVAARSFQQNRSVQIARQAAAQAVEEKNPDARLGKRFLVRPDGSVKVTVVERANTMVIQHIGFLEGLTVAEGKAVGNPPPA